MSTTLVRVLSLLVLITTLATFLDRWFWVSDLLANLRIQQVIGIAACLLVCLLSRHKQASSVVASCLILHLSGVISQCLPDSKSMTDSGPTIKLMTVNVLASNTNHQSIIRHILESEADVVAVLELNSVLATALKSELADLYPHVSAYPDDRGNFGIGLYSKDDTGLVRAFELNESILTLEAQCRGIRIVATHPLPPMSDQLFRSRNEHLSLLAARLKDSKADGRDLPTVVMGDFNVTPWSPHFHDFATELELRRAKTGTGITPTWYARAPFFPFGLVLDHILISPELGCLSYEVGPDIGSDHRSVTASLQLEP